MFEQAEDGSLRVLTGSAKAHPADVVILAIGRPGDRAGEGGRPRDRPARRHPRRRAHADERPRHLRRRRRGRGEGLRDRPVDADSARRAAQRQGRIAADVIAGRDARYRGTQGTSICKIFEGEIGQTGPSEKVLRQLGDTDFEKLYLYLNSHAGYYPGAKMLAIKVLFRKSNGRLLGAQVLGEEGVVKRVDAFAMAIQAGMTIYDLEESELLRTRRRSAARGAGQLCRDGGRQSAAGRHAHQPLGRRRGCAAARRAQSAGAPGGVGARRRQHPARTAPRARLGELPRDRDIHVNPRSGGRAYFATRILLQNGFQAKNISGGMLSRSHRAGNSTDERGRADRGGATRVARQTTSSRRLG